MPTADSARLQHLTAGPILEPGNRLRLPRTCPRKKKGRGPWGRETGRATVTRLRLPDGRRCYRRLGPVSTLWDCGDHRRGPSFAIPGSWRRTCASSTQPRRVSVRSRVILLDRARKGSHDRFYPLGRYQPDSASRPAVAHGKWLSASAGGKAPVRVFEPRGCPCSFSSDRVAARRFFRIFADGKRVAVSDMANDRSIRETGFASSTSRPQTLPAVPAWPFPIRITPSPFASTAMMIVWRFRTASLVRILRHGVVVYPFARRRPFERCSRRRENTRPPTTATGSASVRRHMARTVPAAGRVRPQSGPRLRPRTGCSSRLHWMEGAVYLWDAACPGRRSARCRSRRLAVFHSVAFAPDGAPSSPGGKMNGFPSSG